jgi:hypothetical protein
MIPATAYAVSEAGGKFAIYNFERRQPAADDVLVRIHYCGKFNLKKKKHNIHRKMFTHLYLRYFRYLSYRYTLR